MTASPGLFWLMTTMPETNSTPYWVHLFHSPGGQQQPAAAHTCRAYLPLCIDCTVSGCACLPCTVAGSTACTRFKRPYTGCMFVRMHASCSCSVTSACQPTSHRLCLASEPTQCSGLYRCRCTAPANLTSAADLPASSIHFCLPSAGTSLSQARPGSGTTWI